MPVRCIPIDEFNRLLLRHPVLDVRSPAEFAHGHIPGAFSLALFTDEERRIVGTAYKQESRERAIKIGLEFFGKKTVVMIEQVEGILKETDPTETTKPNRKGTVLVHCWRGGMRSAGVAWLLDLYGFTVYTLEGGYKSFRRWALQQFTIDHPLHVIGGYTGSGKTRLLQRLSENGEAVIDLEQLARHKGSAFGNLDRHAQPSQEMFENELAVALSRHSPGKETIWIEDESQRIGLVNIPGDLVRNMQRCPLFFLEIPFEARLNNIVTEYGGEDREEMRDAIVRISKRLGGLNSKNALIALDEGNLSECFRILLSYYDKTYNKAMNALKNPNCPPTRIISDTADPTINASLFLPQTKNGS